MSLKIYSYENEDPDWPKKAWATKWFANWRCQVCNRKLIPGPQAHCHHNNYDHKRNEIPRDLIAMCDLCHALFTWAEKYRPDLLEWIDDRLRETGEMSARIEMIGEFMGAIKNELLGRLDDIRAELVTLEAGFKAEREWSERRAA